MRSAMLRFAVLRLVVCAPLGLAAAAHAQMAPPLPPEIAAEIGACVCLREASEALGAQMSAAMTNLQRVQDELNRASADLEAERARIDVNNPQSVARFRQLVERRDALFKEASGRATADGRAATDRYNARVNEYNARCANRPIDPVWAARIRPTLTCPPLY